MDDPPRFACVLGQQAELFPDRLAMYLEPVRVRFEKGDSRDDSHLEYRPNCATRITFLNSFEQLSGDARAFSHFSCSDLPIDPAGANRPGKQFESLQILTGVGTLRGFRHTSPRPH